MLQGTIQFTVLFGFAACVMDILINVLSSSRDTYLLQQPWSVKVIPMIDDILFTFQSCK